MVNYLPRFITIFTFLIIFLSKFESLTAEAKNSTWVGSKYEIECTMCSACDNPCNIYSPPPPPPSPSGPNCPPPPSPTGVPYYSPPPPPSYNYYSPPPPSTQPGYYFSPPPPPARMYPTGPTPPPPNPIVPYFPFYYYSPPPPSTAASVQLKSPSFIIIPFSCLLFLFI